MIDFINLLLIYIAFSRGLVLAIIIVILIIGTSPTSTQSMNLMKILLVCYSAMTLLDLLSALILMQVKEINTDHSAFTEVLFYGGGYFLLKTIGLIIACYRYNSMVTTAKNDAE